MPKHIKANDPERIREAKYAINHGRGYEAAASILNVSLRYVKRLAQDGKLPRSKRAGFAKRRPDGDAFRAALADKDLSSCAIAKKYGRSEAYVRECRRRLSESAEPAKPAGWQA